MTSVLVRDAQRRLNRQTDTPRKVVKVAAEMGVMWPQAKDPKGCQCHQDMEEARAEAPLRPPEGQGPAHIDFSLLASGIMR